MKKTTSLATTVALCLTMLGSTLCQAQDADEAKTQRRFNMVDTDKNQSISRKEYKAGLNNPSNANKKFDALDTNKDGSLSFEEFAVKPKKKAHPSGEQGGGSDE